MKLIHAKTEKEAKRICQMFHKMGLKWFDGSSYLSKYEWKHYKENTVYCDNGKFYNISWCIKNGLIPVPSVDVEFKPNALQRVKYFFKRIKNIIK